MTLLLNTPGIVADYIANLYISHSSYYYPTSSQSQRMFNVDETNIQGCRIHAILYIKAVSKGDKCQDAYNRRNLST